MQDQISNTKLIMDDKMGGNAGEMAWQISIKVPNINVREICLVEATLIWADRWTDMMKVTDTSRKYANEPKNQDMLHIRKDLVI